MKRRSLHATVFTVLFFASLLSLLILTGCDADDGDETTADLTDLSGEDAVDAADMTTADASEDTTTTDTTADDQSTTDTTEPAGVEIDIPFIAEVGGDSFACGTSFAGLGSESSTVEFGDLRFYVHDVALLDADATPTPLVLDNDNPFQDDGLALLDFEDASGRCGDNGTAETNDTLRGLAPEGDYVAIEFTLGVPFERNHQDVTTAPSPLNIGGMFWVWQGGYKFLRLDGYVAGDSETTPWNLHLGSTKCASASPMNAPTEECGAPNRVRVRIDNFTPNESSVVLNVATLLANANLSTNTQDTPPGCQSFPPDVNECSQVFPKLGLDFLTGACAAEPCDQSAFTVR